MAAVRTASAVTRMTHVHALRLQGPGALDLLDALTTSRLFVRENQMVQTLLLDAAGVPFADAFVCLEEDAWVVLAEGPTRESLLAHIARVRSERAPAADVTIVDLTQTHALWSIDGPYAWEVTTALLGPEVMGAPYLTFMLLREIVCFRAGKTGEYGYLLLVPNARAEATWQRLQEVGAPLGLVEVDLPTLDQCALENWHFTIRAVRRVALGPDELQLQWRVDLDKDFEGAAALKQRPLTRRLTCFTAKAEVKAGDPVVFEGRAIGEVVEAGFSSTRGDWVGWAILEAGLAWPGIDRFVAGPVAIRTASPPLLDNRSLFVDPRKHSFASRADDVFPPLVTR
jgi:glycine cleavage system aminomethyltransferase T